jgi:hypothetical protein
MISSRVDARRRRTHSLLDRPCSAVLETPALYSDHNAPASVGPLRTEEREVPLSRHGGASPPAVNEIAYR